MLELQFEWDPTKAEENLRNHGVSFEEAQTVFYDDFARKFDDDEQSKWENRFLMFFFFQAEDGIRDLYVTGVQTCALPI